MRQLTESPLYRADLVASTMTVYDGNDQKLGTIETSRQLEDGGDEPHWKEHKRTKTGDPGMVITVDLGLQKDPRDVLKGYGAWTHLRNEEGENGRLQIWGGKSSTDPGSTVVMHVEESTARPMHMTFSRPYRTVMGTLQITVLIEYAAGVDGEWLPRRAVIDQSGRLLFKKRRVHIENVYREWKRVQTVRVARAGATPD